MPSLGAHLLVGAQEFLISLRLLEGTSWTHVRAHLFCRFRGGEEGFREGPWLGTTLLPVLLQTVHISSRNWQRQGSYLVRNVSWTVNFDSRTGFPIITCRTELVFNFQVPRCSSDFFQFSLMLLRMVHQSYHALAQQTVLFFSLILISLFCEQVQLATAERIEDPQERRSKVLKD
jgi:hypothetical protein